jgi:hypothetical protein
MGLKESKHYWCDVCELGVGVTQNDVDEPDDDTELPPGWVSIEARRVVQNPRHAEAIGERAKAIEEHVNDQVLTARSLAAGQNDTLPDDALDGLRRSARHQAESIVGPIEEPEFMVEVAVGHLCKDHSAKLQALDISFGGTQ